MVRAMVADVEEGILPLLGRILERNLGEICPRPLGDDGSAAVCELPGRRALLLQGEEAHPEVDRRLDPQVPISQGHETRELDDGVGAKMVRFKPEELQECAEEGAHRQPEPALKMCEEDDALLPLGPGPLLAVRQADADVHLPRQAPRSSKLHDVLAGDVRAHPGA